jgi:hypothetical protein
VQTLEQSIASGLKTRVFYLVPEKELKRVWPHDENRIFTFSGFVSKHPDWLFFAYTTGHGAIVMRRQPRFRSK